MNDKQDYNNQHYIPQCYLKLFSPGGKYVYFKDSHTTPSELKDIGSICCEDDFYTIYTKKVGRNIFLENNMRDNVENPYSVRLCEITKIGKRAQMRKFPDEIVLSEEKKFQFSAFIVIQYLRMPVFKNYFVLLANEASYLSTLFGHNYVEKKEPNIILNTYPELSPSLLHFNFGYGNLDILIKYAQKLFNDYWEFLFTDSKKVCTSNNPIYFDDSRIKNDVVTFVKDDVAKFAALSNCYEDWVELPYDNLLKFDTYLGFPISRNIYLRIWNKESHPEKRVVDNRFFNLSDKMLTDFNHKTFRNSTEIYSFLPFEDIFPNEINNDKYG